MALYVIGAGATRGASFVNANENSCLPPLDADFFGMLQRIANKKHQVMINRLLADMVKLFGTNFRVTMESVFTTLEQTTRMLETTGENRDFKRSEIEATKSCLVAAIAAVLEESMCDGGQHEGEKCSHHERLVTRMRRRDEIISFNYDCLIDETLKRVGSSKWSPRYGYGFNLGRWGTSLKGDKHWAPLIPATEDSTIKLLKLHGSLNFLVSGERVKLKQRPYTKQHGAMRFTIIPPESNKRYDEGVFRNLWKQAGQALHRAKTIVVIGYSFPATDSHSDALFRISLKRNSLHSLVLVNPDAGARRRAREIFKRGISEKTRVLVFNSLQEFNAIERPVWRRE